MTSVTGTAHSRCSINASHRYCRETPKHRIRNPSLSGRPPGSGHLLSPYQHLPGLCSETALSPIVMSHPSINI